MVRYDNHYTIRMNEQVKDSLKRYCEEHKLKESDFVRKSIEENLISEIQSRGVEPTFPSIFQQTA